MKMMKSKTTLGVIAAISITATGVAVASATGGDTTVSVKAMADALHLVMDSDRSVYTNHQGQ